MKRLRYLPLALFLLLASCGQRAGGPSAWIDQPLDESHLPLQPVQITAHASAPAGIARFEFFIDGTSIGEVDVGGGRMELAEMLWNPQASGTYVVSVAATDGAGSVGDRVSSTIYIGDVVADGLLGGEADIACEGIEAIFLQLEPPVVEPGDCSMASWQVYGPDEWPVLVNGEHMPPFGEMPLCAEEDTDVWLEVETPGGLCRREAALLVHPDGLEPVPGEGGEIFVFFNANPPEISRGECSTLFWEVGPEREYDLQLEGEEVPVFGEMQVCPQNTTSYELQIGFQGRSLAEYATVTVLDGAVQVTPQYTGTPSAGVTSTPAPGVTPTTPPVDSTAPVIGTPTKNRDFCYTTCSGTANDCGAESFYFTVSVTDNVSSGSDISVTLYWTGSGVRSGPLPMHWGGSGSTYFRYIGDFLTTGTLSSFSITATDKAGNSAQISMPSWTLDVEQCGCGG